MQISKFSKHNFRLRCTWPGSPDITATRLVPKAASPRQKKRASSRRRDRSIYFHRPRFPNFKHLQPIIPPFVSSFPGSSVLFLSFYLELRTSLTCESPPFFFYLRAPCSPTAPQIRPPWCRESVLTPKWRLHPQSQQENRVSCSGLETAGNLLRWCSTSLLSGRLWRLTRTW